MNGRQEIPGELVISGGDPSKVREAAEAALDDVAAPVGALAEGVDDNAIGFVGDHRGCAVLDDLAAQSITIITLVGEKLRHEWRERQDIGRHGNVGILARTEVKDDRPAARIAQPMDLGRAPAARAADGLILLPPFPPEAQRRALTEVESSESTAAFLPSFAKASKIARHRSRLAQRLKRL